MRSWGRRQVHAGLRRRTRERFSSKPTLQGASEGRHGQRPGPAAWPALQDAQAAGHRVGGGPCETGVLATTKGESGSAGATEDRDVSQHLRSSVGWAGPGRAGLDWTELGLRGVYETGLGWTRLDEAGLG